MKIDLHVHTFYSGDSVITFEKLVFYAKQRGLDGVAVTDHDTIQGALGMAKRNDIFVVPGMEISTADGHVVALNIQNPIPKGLSVDETLDMIHDAAGVAVACHPAALFKGSIRKKATTKFDAVEVINASAIPFKYSVIRGEQIAHRLEKPRVAGSDAHYGPEIGCAYTRISADPNLDDVTEAIIHGACDPLGTAMPITMRFKREVAMFRKLLH